MEFVQYNVNFLSYSFSLVHPSLPFCCYIFILMRAFALSLVACSKPIILNCILGNTT